MRDVKRFPTTTGLSWLEMSSFKEHLFKGHEKIDRGLAWCRRILNREVAA